MDMRLEGPAGEQEDEPGGLQGAWENGPNIGPGLPGLQGTSLVWQPTLPYAPCSGEMLATSPSPVHRLSLVPSP